MLPHLDAAVRLARWLCLSRADADDVVQEAILRAYRGFDGLVARDAKSWLLVIVRNCHRSELASRRRRPTEPLPGDEDAHDVLVSHAAGPEDEAASADEWRALAGVLMTLPEEHREVLVLKEIEDMSYREIADVVGIPIGTVMSRLARARASLASRWQPAEGGSRAVR